MNTTEAREFLRKESLDIFNRLHSIDQDIKFIEQVYNKYPGIPLVRQYLVLMTRGKSH
jgi:tRNA A64-2'-O-ribosylphosphate transferase